MDSGASALVTPSILNNVDLTSPIQQVAVIQNLPWCDLDQQGLWLGEKGNFCSYPPLMFPQKRPEFVIYFVLGIWRIATFDDTGVYQCSSFFSPRSLNNFFVASLWFWACPVGPELQSCALGPDILIWVWDSAELACAAHTTFPCFFRVLTAAALPMMGYDGIFWTTGLGVQDCA